MKQNCIKALNHDGRFIKLDTRKILNKIILKSLSESREINIKKGNDK